MPTFDYQRYLRHRTIEDAVVYFGQLANESRLRGQEEYHRKAMTEAIQALGEAPTVIVRPAPTAAKRNKGLVALTFLWRDGESYILAYPALAIAGVAWYDQTRKEAQNE